MAPVGVETGTLVGVALGVEEGLAGVEEGVEEGTLTVVPDPDDYQWN